eukprot:PITA_24479
MIMQLDITKAYDKLSWLYIRAILKAYGFDHNWIKWVMALVTTASCSIILHDSLLRTFKPSRGIRQGYPLSPLLFILMMEGLGRAIRAAKEEGRIQGLRLTQGGDTVTHQQFVDDTMLQGTPTVKEAKAFKQIVSEFSRVVGIEYLGVPLTDKPLHKDIWEPVLNKLKDKTRKWTNRALNLVGRLILTKAILQSIPIYMLSAIPAPTCVVTNIRNIQRDFLWGKGEEKKKWALVAWDRVCKPKSHGGLGLHDPRILSRVLGAKIWWRWLKEIQAPSAKVWKQKYASDWQEKNLIRMTGQVKGFAIWNRAWENRALVKNHSFWEIRNGNLAWF